MIKPLFFISLLINFFLLFYKYRKEIKIFLNKSNIKKKNITELHQIFKLRKISNNLSGPSQKVITKSFCISADNRIVGMTSDYEAWIIGCLSKVSKNIFEFGTCSGKTTYIMALNTSKNSKITTITLKQDNLTQLEKKKLDNKISFRNIKNESVYEKFLFSNELEEKKINVIFQNSLDFDESQYVNSMDLIFIDGGHTFSVVKNDTEKAFKMIKKDGIILWHDYILGKESSKDVVRYLNQISKKKKIYSIENTSFCYFKKTR
jgi:predicted O-methyltransferase YrrM